MSGQQSQALAGLIKETTFGTGVAVTGAAARYVPLLSETLEAKRPPVLSKERNGSGGARDFLGDGSVEAGGQLVEQARYDLTTDPAHPLLEQIFGQARGHVLRKIVIGSGNTVSWIALRHGTNDNVELANQFTPAVAASAGMSVRLRLRRRGTPTGNLSVEIQTDAAGAPSGTPVSNGTSANVNVAGITADDTGEEVEFTFSTSPSLAAGTVYHLVLKGDYSLSATNQIQWAVEDVASGGIFEIKDFAYADDATKHGIGRILTTSFIDTYLMAKTHEGLFASCAVDKGQRVHQYVSVKATSFALAAKPKEGVTFTFGVLFASEQAAGSVSTTAAQLAGLKTSRTRPLFTDLTVKVGPQTAALGAGDALAVDSLEFSLARPADSVRPSGQDTIIEPLEENDREVLLVATLPRYAANTVKNWELNKTPLQAIVQFTAGGKYWTLLLPNGRVNGAVGLPTDGTKAYQQRLPLVFGLNQAPAATVNPYLNIPYEAELSLLA